MNASSALALIDSSGLSGVVGTWPEKVRYAFSDYLDLPTGERSLRALAARYEDEGASSAVGVSLRTLQNWSAQYGWVELVRPIADARASAARSEALERLSTMTDVALDHLGELMVADKAMMTPEGDIEYVPDNAVRLKAVESVLDRDGLTSVQRSAVTVSGPGGGPMQHAHLVVDLTDKSPAELLDLLKRQAMGDR